MEPQQPTNFKSTLLTQEERANFYPLSSDLKQPERRSWGAFPLQFLDLLSHGKQQWRTNGCRQGDPSFPSTRLPLWGSSWGQFWKSRQAQAPGSTTARRHPPGESAISLRFHEVNCQRSLTKRVKGKPHLLHTLERKPILRPGKAKHRHMNKHLTQNILRH